MAPWKNGIILLSLGINSMEKKDSSINLKLLHEKLDPVNEVALIRLKSTLHSVISKAFLSLTIISGFQKKTCFLPRYELM